MSIMNVPNVKVLSVFTFLFRIVLSYLYYLFFSFFADPRTLMRAASSEEQNLRQPENPAFKGQRPSSSAEFCPSCREAFDCGKKRRLIDSCGHERCYTCMFSKELCSLCTIEGMCEEIFLFKVPVFYCLMKILKSLNFY